MCVQSQKQHYLKTFEEQKKVVLFFYAFDAREADMLTNLKKRKIGACLYVLIPNNCFNEHFYSFVIFCLHLLMHFRVLKDLRSNKFIILDTYGQKGCN